MSTQNHIRIGIWLRGAATSHDHDGSFQFASSTSNGQGVVYRLRNDPVSGGDDCCVGVNEVGVACRAACRACLDQCGVACDQGDLGRRDVAAGEHAKNQ